ncbi:hypothetical protein COO91_07724 [Nostoc flagelliforme CCNUN1]|uniref:Uncharacterized protein n=1 Tax=Nostoc flagelliforme CCNUN1 TaxID=2038116 RepID=A0A2K8T215_9NOSO|nr:hypothetical protein [Nostoc flagelliforme]AUB41670.1 hypothetical protein COO91_07724 [Nostoc flagelliforme CCNUN1]
MPTLDLERLGLIDLSDDQEALTLTVGGGRAAGVTYFFSSIVGSPSFSTNGSIVENQPIPPGGTGVALRDSSYFTVGWLRPEAGGSYSGRYSSWLATSPSLNFTRNDNRVAVNRST